MLPKHKDLKKYIGLGVIYAPKGSLSPRRLTIIELRIGSVDVNGYHLLFDLADFPRNVPHKDIQYQWYSPDVKDVKETDVYENLMSYLRDKIRVDEKSLEICQSSIEYNQSQIKKMTDSLHLKCQDRFKKIMERFSSKTGGISCMSEFLEEARQLDCWLKEEKAKIEKQKEYVERIKNEYRVKKESWERLTRRERSAKIRQEWTRKHQES